MTLSKRPNSLAGDATVPLRSTQYFKINLILAGVILLIMAYSGIFSPDTDNYPVACIHEKMTGLKCFSCGLSHSMSLILRGRIAEAREWNIYGIRVFLFFSVQLVFRIVFTLIYSRLESGRRKLIIGDAVVSALMILYTFYPFIRQIAVEFLISLKS